MEVLSYKLMCSLFIVYSMFQILLVYASPVKGDWERQEFLLVDETGEIKVKFWDAQVALFNPDFLNQTVIVKNLVLDHFGGQRTIGSTKETTIQVRQKLY